MSEWIFYVMKCFFVVITVVVCVDVFRILVCNGWLALRDCRRFYKKIPLRPGYSKLHWLWILPKLWWMQFWKRTTTPSLTECDWTPIRDEAQP